MFRKKYLVMTNHHIVEHCQLDDFVVGQRRQVPHTSPPNRKWGLGEGLEVNEIF